MIHGEFGIGHHYWHGASRSVFCIPPKCGSSAMKYALLMASHPHLGVLFEEDTSRVHQFSHLTMVKRKSQIIDAERKIFIARDPARRALSAFLSKFVYYPESHITQSICGFAEISMDDISFRNYIKTICEVPDAYLDPHFRSQEDFILMPIDEYEVISIDRSKGDSYSSIIDSIYCGGSQNYFSLLEREEIRKIGPVKDGARDTLRGRLVDVPVKQLRYLRINGSSLPAEEFWFDGFEEGMRERYEYDYRINSMSSKQRDSDELVDKVTE